MQLPKSWFKFSRVEHGFPKDDLDPGQPKRALQQPHGRDHQRPRGQRNPLQSELFKRIPHDRDHQRGQRRGDQPFKDRPNIYGRVQHLDLPQWSLSVVSNPQKYQCDSMGLQKFFHHSAIVLCITFHV